MSSHSILDSGAQRLKMRHFRRYVLLPLIAANILGMTMYHTLWVALSCAFVAGFCSAAAYTSWRLEQVLSDLHTQVTGIAASVRDLN